MRDIAELARDINQLTENKRSQANSSAQSRDNTDKLVNAIGNVKLDMPEGFKLDWGISINGLKELLVGLDLTMDQIKKLTNELPGIVDKLDKNADNQKAELRDLVDAVKSIKAPDVVVPEMPSEFKVTDLSKVIRLLTKLTNKPDFERTEIELPPFPESVTVNNLDMIVDKLDALVPAASVEEAPVGFAFNRDSNGNLESLTEVYPSGNVTSTGWNIGRVRIVDERKA